MYFVAWQKPTQYYKAIIFQLEKLMKDLICLGLCLMLPILSQTALPTPFLAHFVSNKLIALCLLKISRYFPP